MTGQGVHSKTLPRMLLLLTLAHGLVDAFASLVQPLWPDLRDGLRLDDGSIQGAYVLWGLATSVTQLVFGYWGDRDRGRWLLWAGPIAAVVCLSLVGAAPSFGALAALLAVGGLGIAAFHPEAAAMAGSCAPDDRSRAMSIFAVGGYLGQAAGPIYSGVVTTRYGLGSLAWSVAWGLPALAVVLLGLRPPAPEAPHPRAAGPVSIAGLVRGRGVAVALVLAIGVLRVIPAMGVPLALAYLIKARGGSNEWVGLVQSAFLAGIGGGNLACAVFVRRGVERRVLWRLPLVVAPILWACPQADGAALLACGAAGGLLLGATMPILVSYGQRLMPEAQRVASSITMGVTWGVGGVVVAGTMTAVNRIDRPGLAFPIFAVGCVVSSALCAWLPAEHPGEGRGRLATARPAT